ncbi:MAG: hypothetical protein V1489_02675 [Candidatus Liptonbacteria bacterium]
MSQVEGRSETLIIYNYYMQEIMSNILNSPEARPIGMEKLDFASGEVFGPWADEPEGV